MERSVKLKSELPDSVMSYIFSMLSMKDLVKTSTLSKQWLHEWGLRTDLNFDLQNMFDYNTIQELLGSLPLFKGVQSEFSRRVDQFMLHYQGAMVRSLRVNFPLGDEHSDVIGRLVSQGIAKGVVRIELLFSFKTSVTDLVFGTKPYKFSYTHLSDTDSLKYLHLESCLLVAPMELSGFKNLRTLVLHLVAVDKDLLLGLFSKCIHLVDLTLNECKFNSNLNIISPTLRHLNIVHRGRRCMKKINIFASNLSSFEYSSDRGHKINIKAHKLSKISYNARQMSKPIGFSGLKNVTTIVLDGLCEQSHTNLVFGTKPYKFSYTHLSDTDSLKYLHLENCLLVAPMELSGFKNLRTLVLHLVAVDKDLLLGLFSKCIHLVDLTLNECKFNSNLNIISPTLRHLNIVHRGRRCMKKINIFASNLSSFEYSSDRGHKINIKAHKLSKISYNARQLSKPIGFSGLKNVTTIVLDGLCEPLCQIMPRLFSKCLQLEDVTFKNCTLIRDVKIISRKLRHLNIIDCGYDNILPSKIDIDALNLSSFDYSGRTRISSIKARMLLKVFWNETKQKEKSCPFDLIASLHQLENLAVIMSHSQIAKLPRVLGPFQNLRQLEFFVEGAYDPDMDYFWILDIAMVSLHLQKLSLTIRNSHLENSHMIAFQRQRREYAGFFHNELKYVELCGCVGTINVIELASHLLRNVNSLKKITFRSRDRFYIGAGRWTEGSDSCGWFGRNLIREMLKDDVNEKCQLIIL